MNCQGNKGGGHYNQEINEIKLLLTQVMEAEDACSHTRKEVRSACTSLADVIKTEIAAA